MLESKLDEIIRMHMQSRYMISLYQEKKRVLGESVLTDEEKDNYVYHCALRNSTAELIYVFYRQLINTIDFSKLPPLAMDMLKRCQAGYEISNKKSIGLEEIYNNPTYKSEYYYQKCSDFGFMDINDMKKLFEGGSDGFWLNNLDKYRDDVYMNILGCKRSESEDVLSNEISDYLAMSDDVRAEYINKMFACWSLHTTSKSISVIQDKAYSKMKYPDYNTSNALDYNELLASVGIDMGKLPKTFVSEIYGDSRGQVR